MKKLLMLSILALFMFNFQLVEAKTNITETPVSDVIQEEEYDFNSSYYLTEEQIQDAKEVDDIEHKVGFWEKIVNSSHFSSNTATKTYIPINKVGK